jgi:transcriptional regulator with XRE-family HTH domain
MNISYTIGMNTLAGRLKFIFEHKKRNNEIVNKTGLWKACKLSSGAVSQWFSGQTKELRGDNLLNASSYLGVNPDWLATGKGDPFAKKKSPADTLVIAGMEIHTNEDNLIAMYRSLSTHSQIAIDLLTNRLYELEDPHNKKANPFPTPPTKKEKQN